MDKREDPGVGALLAAAVAILCISIAAVVIPVTSATSQASAASPAGAAPGEGPGYLPAQVVNQAKEIEPMPATF